GLLVGGGGDNMLQLMLPVTVDTLAEIANDLRTWQVVGADIERTGLNTAHLREGEGAQPDHQGDDDQEGADQFGGQVQFHSVLCVPSRFARVQLPSSCTTSRGSASSAPTSRTVIQSAVMPSTASCPAHTPSARGGAISVRDT